MNDNNISALLAFMNLLTAKLQLEEIYSINEARNLVPIFLNLIKTGELIFLCDPDCNFTTAVNFISNDFSGPYVKNLRPKLADRGDQQEMANIILALIYVLRVMQKSKFREFCEELDAKNNSSIARMVEKLDSFGRWSPASFASVLHQSNLPTITKCDETTDAGNKENIACTTSNQASKTPSTLINSSPFRGTPRVATRHSVLNFDSPINKVLMSPRGEEVVRIHALTKEVESLRESKEILRHENDRLDDLCHTKDTEIINLEATVKRINSLHSRLQSQTERIPFLEERIINLEQLNAQLTKNLREAENKYESTQVHLSDITFQRDDAFRKIALMEEDSKHLQVEFEKAKQRAQDELGMHDQTRKKIAEIERHFNNEIVILKKRIRDLDEMLEEERKLFKSNIQQKEHEHAEQLQIYSEIKERSEELQQSLNLQIKQKEQELQKQLAFFAEFDNRLKEMNQNIYFLEKELKDSREIIDGLLPICQQQAKCIAQLEMELQRKQQHNNLK